MSNTLSIRKPAPAAPTPPKNTLKALVGKQVSIRTRGHTICTGILDDAQAGAYVALRDMHEVSAPDQIDRRWPGLTYLDKGAILFVAEGGAA